MTSLSGWLLTAALWLYYGLAILAHLPEIPWTLLALHLAGGVVAVAAVLGRRRWPLATVVVAALALVITPSVLGGTLFCQASLARHRRRFVGILTALFIVAAKLLGLLVGPSAGPWSSAASFELTTAIAGTAVVTVLGWLLDTQEAGSRSASAAELARQDAEQAKLEQARMAERERIAREMHDVLAHRLSLVALHAGALAYRSDLDPATARETAALIQSNAKQSLADLRSVLGSLRDPGSGSTPEPPQPSLVDLPVLLAEAADAGQRIEHRLNGVESVPALVSRHAYRIVQEALTNARKHAPGAPVTVQVDWTTDPGTPDAVRIRVRNPITDLARPTLLSGDAPGDAPGYGLVGVAERVSGTGGTVTHGIVDDTFVLEATLPTGERA